MTSGSTNGISASERRSAPTSSSAIDDAGAAQRLDAGEHLGGPVGEGALGELEHDVELAARRASAARAYSAGTGASSSDGSTLTNSVLRRPAASAPRSAAARQAQSSSATRPGLGGGGEQHVRALQRRADRPARERLVGDDLLGVEVDDRLVDGPEQALGQDVAQFGDERGLLQNRGHQSW